METQQLIFILCIIYFIISVFIAIEAMGRGHNLLRVVVYCIFCTPLIGAIMFNQYKQKTLDKPKEEPWKPEHR